MRAFSLWEQSKVEEQKPKLSESETHGPDMLSASAFSPCGNTFIYRLIANVSTYLHSRCIIYLEVSSCITQFRRWLKLRRFWLHILSRSQLLGSQMHVLLNKYAENSYLHLSIFQENPEVYRILMLNLFSNWLQCILCNTHSDQYEFYYWFPCSWHPEFNYFYSELINLSCSKSFQYVTNKSCSRQAVRSVLWGLNSFCLTVVRDDSLFADSVFWSLLRLLKTRTDHSQRNTGLDTYLRVPTYSFPYLLKTHLVLR